MKETRAPIEKKTPKNSVIQFAGREHLARSNSTPNDRSVEDSSAISAEKTIRLVRTTGIFNIKSHPPLNTKVDESCKDSRVYLHGE
jgi:hypothetical protein